ncbi:transporter substrate-binding domain-containing protein [Thalassotalea sp. G2M2-11]|uniref:substrate-binding periplasmic protein n=1 Tax=Thalassotalea sp. G2M2-11 TaxID=2787627 RepID=UPI0019D0C606|nr:transporter substrate-binding domain-containing protein [Thalassotalea sp. G2M2-11]
MRTTVFKLFIWLIFISLLSSNIQAKERLTVAVGLAKPPYVIQHNDSGFELDLIRNVFEQMGYSVEFIYTSFGHSVKMLDVKEVDVVMTTNNRVFKDESKLSDRYITYQNVAISLASENLSIDSISDLANYSIAAFQKADKVLGDEYSTAINQSPLYLSVANQAQQPVLLMKKRVQVLVMDKNIFNYLLNQLAVPNKQDAFIIHPIFPKTHYRLAFKRQKHLTLFNQEFDKYRHSDAYQLLKKQYDL